MKRPGKVKISPRKAPRQARSTRLVGDVLQAAARVLAREGARRFTTARVAEAAGVSVGSLYQYFPNKEALLFRLQLDEWQHTGALLDGILADVSRPPLDRVRSVVHEFFRSECEEAELRVALGDAAPLYRDAAETSEHRAAGKKRSDLFMREALPGIAVRQRALVADVVMTTMSSVGKAVSEQNRSKDEIDRVAAAVADMLCCYLSAVASGDFRRA